MKDTHGSSSWMSRISPECFPLFTDAPSDDRNLILGIRSPTLSSLKVSNMHCLRPGASWLSFGEPKWEYFEHDSNIFGLQ